MKTLEQRAAAAAKEHVARMAILAAEAVERLSFPSEQRAAVVAAAITIIDREFRRNLFELEKEAEAQTWSGQSIAHSHSG